MVPWLYPRWRATLRVLQPSLSSCRAIILTPAIWVLVVYDISLSDSKVLNHYAYLTDMHKYSMIHSKALSTTQEVCRGQPNRSHYVSTVPFPAGPQEAAR